MNERIEKLYKQASKQDCFPQDGEEVYMSAEDLKKFAELLVKECIDILPEKVKIDDLYDGKILVQCGTAIKEHFGV